MLLRDIETLKLLTHNGMGLGNQRLGAIPLMVEPSKSERYAVDGSNVIEKFDVGVGHTLKPYDEGTNIIVSGDSIRNSVGLDRGLKIPYRYLLSLFSVNKDYTLIFSFKLYAINILHTFIRNWESTNLGVSFVLEVGASSNKIIAGYSDPASRNYYAIPDTEMSANTLVTVVFIKKADSLLCITQNKVGKADISGITEDIHKSVDGASFLGTRTGFSEDFAFRGELFGMYYHQGALLDPENFSDGQTLDIKLSENVSDTLPVQLGDMPILAVSPNDIIFDEQTALVKNVKQFTQGGVGDLIYQSGAVIFNDSDTNRRIQFEDTNDEFYFNDESFSVVIQLKTGNSTGDFMYARNREVNNGQTYEYTWAVFNTSTWLRFRLYHFNIGTDVEDNTFTTVLLPAVSLNTEYTIIASYNTVTKAMRLVANESYNEKIRTKLTPLNNNYKTVLFGGLAAGGYSANSSDVELRNIQLFNYPLL